MHFVRSIWKRLQNREHTTTLGAIFLFAFATFFFTLTTSHPSFNDPDAYYHMTLTQIMLDTRGVVTDFPWLQFTTLKDAYVDHHLLYHIFLLPFVAAFGQPLGLKIATTLLGAAVISVLYIVLRRFHVRYASVWSLLLLFTYDFTFRISLGKGNSFSLLFLLIAFVAIVERRERLLAVLSFLYVWAYGGFVQLLLVACIAAVIELGFTTRLKKLPSFTELLHAVRLPAVCALSMIAGLIFHPSFPQNISFLWEQFIQIGVINYSDTISVGAEWYPLSVRDLLIGSNVLCALTMLSLFVTVRYRKNISPHSLVAGCMSILMIILTLKSRRYIEYAVPWTVLWSALALQNTQWVQHAILKRLHTSQDRLSRLVTMSVAGYAIVGMLALGILCASRLYDDYAMGIAFTRMHGVGKWLEEHAPEGSQIFHDDWSVFPMLFHQAPHMRYIVGLDATFMYRYNEELYRTWVAITGGEKKDHLYNTIAHDFESDYIVMDQKHTAMRENIDATPGFSLVYEDSDGVIYRVTK